MIRALIRRELLASPASIPSHFIVLPFRSYHL
jgi:hypothetical protein